MSRCSAARPAAWSWCQCVTRMARTSSGRPPRCAIPESASPPRGSMPPSTRTNPRDASPRTSSSYSRVVARRRPRARRRESGPRGEHNRQRNFPRRQCCGIASGVEGQWTGGAKQEQSVQAELSSVHRVQGPTAVPASVPDHRAGNQGRAVRRLDPESDAHDALLTGAACHAAHAPRSPSAPPDGVDPAFLVSGRPQGHEIQGDLQSQIES